MLSSPSLPRHRAHALNATSHRRHANPNPNPFPPLRIPSSTAPRRLGARANQIGASRPSPVSGSQTARGSNVDATEVRDGEMDRMLEVGNRAADVAGEVLRKYFRQRFDIIDKEDLSKRSFPFFFSLYRSSSL